MAIACTKGPTNDLWDNGPWCRGPGARHKMLPNLDLKTKVFLINIVHRHHYATNSLHISRSSMQGVIVPLEATLWAFRAANTTGLQTEGHTPVLSCYICAHECVQNLISSITWFNNWLASETNSYRAWPIHRYLSSSSATCCSTQ